MSDSHRFESLVGLVRKDSTILNCKLCLERALWLSTLRHRSIDRIALEISRVNVRIFIGAHMIVCKPERVFSTIGEHEQSLIVSAARMLALFEQIMLEVSSGKAFHTLSAAVTSAFPIVLFEYLRCFNAWRVPDAQRLSSRVHNTLAALYRAKAQLPAEAERLGQVIRGQIEQLRGRLLQIAGADAIARFDAENGTLPVTISAG